MTFTGTLIEDLMATVERAEQSSRSHAAPMLAETPLLETSPTEVQAIETWFVSVPENADYDFRFIGVA